MIPQIALVNEILLYLPLLLIPIGPIIGALSGLAGLFGNKGGLSMKDILPIILGIGGGALEGREGARRFDSSFDETGRSEVISTPEQEALQRALLTSLLESIQQPIDVGVDLGDLDTIRQSELMDINRQSDIAQQNISDTLAQRGLSNSPGVAATAFGTAEAGRGQAISALNRDIAGRRLDLSMLIPQIAEQIRNQRFGTASNILAQTPRGSTQTTSGTREGTAPGQGALGGGALGGMQTLAWLLGQNRGISGIPINIPNPTNQPILLPGQSTPTFIPKVGGV